jgi:hypothetical protein
MLTKSQLNTIVCLHEEIRKLQHENKTLKKTIVEMSKNNICTCGIDTKELVRGEDWLNCPVHCRTFKRGEL